VAPEEDKQNIDNTGEISRKTFMFPNRCIGEATKKMLLKHNLQIAAREMNIMPHLALVSAPKLADAEYTTILSKDGMAIYNDNTKPSQQTTSPSLNPIGANTPECGD
jgi:hypothetical protein